MLFRAAAKSAGSRSELHRAGDDADLHRPSAPTGADPVVGARKRHGAGGVDHPGDEHPSLGGRGYADAMTSSVRLRSDLYEISPQICIKSL
jgi:hypothetical protein